MTEQRKRKQIDLMDKYHAIIAVENKTKSNADLCKELGCSKGAVSAWMKDEEKEKKRTSLL